MSYLVLARKYRPQTFEEVVGQTHVTTTLGNSILSGRVAHAILFSGPRGTGKTTVARILAKTINCDANRDTPSAIPCNTCRSCREITSGHAVDVFEIDGASNNSVDQVRELRDNVRYMPAHSPYKIYIIDEVHMLSLAAFNALLKTLEEPPAHVKFMFATTEPHKIPITILSRCQRHDMRRVDLEKVVRHLASLCSQEAVGVEEKSLALIAQEAGGSVRDALSLLDQVISCAVGNVDHKQVLNILGTVDRQNLFDISQALLTKDTVRVLDLIDQVYDRGHDLKKFYASITEHFRNLLVVKLTKNKNRLVDVSQNEIELMESQVEKIPSAFLTQIMDMLFAEESSIRFSTQPRFALEIVLIKLLQIEPALSIETLIKKLDLLQKNAGGPVKELNGSEGAAYTAPPPEQSHPSVSEAPSEFNQNMSNAPRPQKPANGPVQNLSPVSPTDADIKNFQAQEKNAATTNGFDNGSTTPPSNYNPADPLDVSWNKFKSWFTNINRALAPSLAKSTLKKISAESIDIEIGGSNFSIQRIQNSRNKLILENACKEYFRTNSGIVIAANYMEADINQKKRAQSDQLKKETMSNPVVSEAIKVFNGNVDIKIL